MIRASADARGNVELACTKVMEGLELEVAINDAWGIGLAVDVVAHVAAQRGHHEEAASCTRKRSSRS